MLPYRIGVVGHRNIFGSFDLDEKIIKLLADIFSFHDYTETYLGRNGDFDITFARAVKIARKGFGERNHSLTLVLPYHAKDEDLFADYYDDIYMPIPPSVHYKAAIRERNRWIVDNSDIFVCYVEKTYGGAYQALKYAEKQKKEILNIANAVIV